MSEGEGIIIELVVEKTYNLGNYESLKVGARVAVPLGGSVEKAEAKLVGEIERLKQKVMEEKATAPSRAEPPQAEKEKNKERKWVAVKDKYGFSTYHEEAEK